MTCRCYQRFCYACGATESVYVHSGCSAARAVSLHRHNMGMRVHATFAVRHRHCEVYQALAA